jgi:hypothetical protein
MPVAAGGAELVEQPAFSAYVASRAASACAENLLSLAFGDAAPPSQRVEEGGARGSSSTGTVDS